MLNTRSVKTSAIIAGTAGALLAFQAQAASLDVPSGTYALDVTHGSIVFKIDHIGLSFYTARFNTFDATVTLDADVVSQCSVSVTVETDSIDTDFPFADRKDFNAELRNADWLNVEEFPQATFTSTAIEVTGDNTATITGDFSFRGVTKPVTLDATLNGALPKHPFMEAAAIGISAEGSFKRSDFGFDRFIPNVGDEVKILIEAEFIEKK
jgi:polyisoprenoid-binding protein YceI